MNITAIYKLILWFLIGVARYSKELSYEVDVLQADIHESLLQVDSIIFDGFDKACSKYSGKFCNIVVKIVRNEVTGLTALAGSNTTLKIYYTSIAHSSMSGFLSQYRFHTKHLLQLINCFYNISG